MNERVQELAKEAKQYADVAARHPKGINIPKWNEVYHNKFAELIVRECLHNMENCDGDLDFAIWKTKQDFGVES